MMTSRSSALRTFFAIAIALALSGHALAQEKIRIGIIGPFTGLFATAGVQYRQGIATFLALNGNRVGGREVEVLFRDVGGTNPAVAKRLAEELIVRDKVALLGGLYLSPEATAIAPVVNETRVPAVLFTAASPGIMKQSNLFIRAGDNVLQAALPPADWAIKRGARRAYIAVADYAPGHDVQGGFKGRFTQLGGSIVGEDRMPLNTVDFAPFAERIANAHADVITVFIPAGAPAVSFMKALVAQGVSPTRIPIVGSAETDDNELHLFDDSVIGVYSSLYYAIDAPFAANRRFKDALAKTNGASAIPTFSTMSAYDGMGILYRMIESQKGKPFDGPAAVKAMEGVSWESPRGPVTIEAATHELTQPMYIRRVERVAVKLQNSIVETFPAVKAP